MGSHSRAQPLDAFFQPEWASEGRDTSDDFTRWGNGQAQGRLASKTDDDDATAVLDQMFGPRPEPNPISPLRTVDPASTPTAYGPQPGEGRTVGKAVALSPTSGSLSAKPTTKDVGKVRMGSTAGVNDGAERLERGTRVTHSPGSFASETRFESGRYAKSSASPTGGSLTGGRRTTFKNNEFDHSATASKDGEFYGGSVSVSNVDRGQGHTPGFGLKVGAASDGDEARMNLEVSGGNGDKKLGGGFRGDTETGEFGGSATYKGTTLGVSRLDGGFSAGASYKDFGGSILWQRLPGMTRMGAQVGLGKNAKLGGSYSRTKEGYHASGDAMAFGVGGGFDVGEVYRTDTSFVGGRDRTSRTEGSSSGGRAGLGVVGFKGSGSHTDTTTATQVRPKDYDSWTDEQKQAYQDNLFLRSVSQSDERGVDLDDLLPGTGVAFSHNRETAGGGWVGPDIGIAALKGEYEQRSGKSSGVEVSNLGSSFLVSESSGKSESRKLTLSAGLGVRADGSVDRGTATADRQEYSVERGVQHKAQERLRDGLVPGALDQDPSDPDVRPLYDDYCTRVREVARLEQEALTSTDHRHSIRLGLARRALDAAMVALGRHKLASTKVGEYLSDGVRMQRKTHTDHENSTENSKINALFWNLRTDSLHTARTQTTSDFLGRDGEVHRSQGIASERQKDEDPSESLSLETSNDRQGPAFQFKTKAHIQSDGQLDQATRRNLTIPAGYGADSFDRSKEQLTTMVSLGHDDTRRIAETLNDKDHRAQTWSAMSERMTAHGVDKSLLEVTTPEAFDALAPDAQERWVMALHDATVHSETGNVFEAIAAIERIADPELRRKVYTRVLEDADKRGANQVIGGDLGAEFIAFAERFQGSGLKLGEHAKLTASNDATEVLAGIDDPASAFKMSADAWTQRGLLRLAHGRGGPDKVESLLRAAGWDAATVYARLTDEPSDRQWIGHLLQGTVMGARVQHLIKRLNPSTPGDDGTYPQMPDLAQVFDETKAIDKPEARAEDVGSKRSLAVRRSLDVAGSESVVVETLLQAWRDSPDHLEQVVRDSGITPEQFDRITRTEGVMLPFTV